MANFTFFQWVSYILEHHWRNFLYGTYVTVYLSFIGTVVGFIIGLLLALVRTKDLSRVNLAEKIVFKIFQKLIDLYVLLFRSTPMIVQSIIFYYGLTQLTGINIDPIPAALIVVSINTGAYISEIVRGGITAVDKGQYEAAISLGMTHTQTMIYVVLPQAIRSIIPAIGNEFIINIKDTAVLFAIGVTELYTTSRTIAGTYSRFYEVFIITSIIYLALTFSLSNILKMIENYLEGSNHFEMEEE